MMSKKFTKHSLLMMLGISVLVGTFQTTYTSQDPLSGTGSSTGSSPIKKNKYTSGAIVGSVLTVWIGGAIAKIRYESQLPKKESDIKPEYSWTFNKMSEKSGIKEKALYAFDNMSRIVADNKDKVYAFGWPAEEWKKVVAVGATIYLGNKLIKREFNLMEAIITGAKFFFGGDAALGLKKQNDSAD